MARQVLDRGKTYVTLRVPAVELETTRAEIDRRLKDQEYLILVAEDKDHKIVVVTLVSTTPDSQQAFDALAGGFTDSSNVRTVADNPAVPHAELDF